MKRFLIPNNANVSRKSGLGDAWPGCPARTLQSADAASTITAQMLLGGIYERSGLTAGRTDTTMTGTQLAAELAARGITMDVGETFMCYISNRSGQTLTIGAGTDITLGTTTTIATGVSKFLYITRTGATTFTIEII